MQFILGMVFENEQFARRCAEEGIKFIGPHLEHLDMLEIRLRLEQLLLTLTYL